MKSFQKHALGVPAYAVRNTNVEISIAWGGVQSPNLLASPKAAVEAMRLGFEVIYIRITQTAADEVRAAWQEGVVQPTDGIED